MHKLPDPNHPAREMFDVADLAAVGTGERLPIAGLPAARAMARRLTYNRSENAQREFKVLLRRPAMGRTQIQIECPFCLTQFWAYVRSLSGGGKKCENKACGAMHTGFGVAFPVEGGEPK